VLAAELNVTANYIETLGVAQKCLYGKFTLPAKKKIPHVGLYVKRPTLHLNKRMCHLLMAFFRRNLAKPVVMTDKLLRSFSIFASVAVTCFRN
jgi:hypothetical protein